jgi:UDP-N-acetylmuramate--alanine ligase
MASSGAPALPQHVHLIGIGGAGLSAIARVLAMRGHRVTGSDLRSSPITQALGALGIATYEGHAAEHVDGAELVVVSSAVPEDNPEVVAARAAGQPVLRRQELMPRLMAGHKGVAVAGTHGKTTTTGMLAYILERAGCSPTYIVGGVLSDLGTNASVGTGPHFVIEADEYDGMFLGLRPHVAIVTNVEMDHPDCYQDLNALCVAFGRFLDGVLPDGAIIACSDCVALAQLVAQQRSNRAPAVTYGLKAGNDYRAVDAQPVPDGGMRFRVVRGAETWGTFHLVLPGIHNVLNATAALVAAERLGVERRVAGEALATFRGALRHFEVKGERGGITIVDDYAHHPTEIRATLAAARGRYDGRRIWAVWEPHTYSRIAALLDEFGACFGDADQVIVTDVYAARSHERAIIHPETVVASIDHPNVHHVGGREQVVAYLLDRLESGDVLLTLGAGDGYRIGEDVLARLAREAM